MTRQEFIENQKTLCKEKDWPFFMPSDGRCYYCRGDIITELIKKGKDGTELVSGCPLCFYRYCE